MKRCPQCNSLYENAVQFCLNDGTPLVEESFILPSDEDEESTIVRHDPITINIPDSDEYSAPTDQPIAPSENVVIVPAEKPTPTGNYALFLIIGLLLGGGLVLATLLLTRNYSQSSNADSNQKIIGSNQQTNAAKPNPANANANLKTPDVETASAKHAEPNDDANDGLFNGRVIVTNARIRRDPSSTAPVTDVLPYGDRLDIIDRANSNSPWYQVECEHGTTGWMHGDTIEFTKGNF